MSPITRRFALAALICLSPCLAFAQSVDLAGTWDITATATPLQRGEVGPEPCTFSGEADVSQSGETLSGSANMTLDSGDNGCPAEMSALLSGSIDGGEVFLQLTDPTLGVANLEGTLLVRGTADVEGTMSVDSGPFSGYGGGFSAVFRGTAAPAIPTVGNLAILAFVLMLASLGLLLARDRTRAV